MGHEGYQVGRNKWSDVGATEGKTRDRQLAAGLAGGSLAVCPGMQSGQVTCLSGQVGPASPSVAYSWTKEWAGGQAFVQKRLTAPLFACDM